MFNIQSSENIQTIKSEDIEKFKNEKKQLINMKRV